jgi:hypothetical protein
MEQGVPWMPTVAETIRLHANLWGPGGPSGWLGIAGSIAVLVALALVLPPMSLEDPPIAVVISGTLGPMLNSAHREYRYGGSALSMVVATITGLTIGAVVLAAFFTISSIVGGTLSFLIPGGLSADFLIAFFLGLMALLVVHYFVRRSRPERGIDPFEAEVRAERARRGLPTAR